MNRYAYCIFADDVRQETNGKMLYIGTYFNDMRVQEFPFTIPKLSIITTVVSPIEKPFETVKLKYCLE